MTAPMNLVSVVLLAALGLTGCSIIRAQTAADAQTEMVGMSRQQILRCMGPANRSAAAGASEIWSYDTGNGRINSLASVTRTGTSATGQTVRSGRHCTVIVEMRNGRVEQLKYLGATGGLLTRDEQCASAVKNCIR